MIYFFEMKFVFLVMIFIFTNAGAVYAQQPQPVRPMDPQYPQQNQQNIPPRQNNFYGQPQQNIQNPPQFIGRGMTPSPTPSSGLLSDSVISGLAQSIFPTIIAVIGIGGGGLIAWYSSKKKHTTFDGFVRKITEIQHSLIDAQENKDLSRGRFLQELDNLKEEIDLAFINKRLDVEQHTFILGKIKTISRELK